MFVKALKVIHYPPDGSHWKATVTPNPNWEAIESAIRRLDRSSWPIVDLHTDEHVPGDESVDVLSITGGRGEYWLTFLPKVGAELHFVDVSRGQGVIQVWESDQGALVVEKHLCNSISLVFDIAGYFAETGRLHPGVRWEAY